MSESEGKEDEKEPSAAPQAEDRLQKILALSNEKFLSAYEKDKDFSILVAYGTFNRLTLRHDDPEEKEKGN